jgi:hypothetical protein
MAGQRGGSVLLVTLGCLMALFVLAGCGQPGKRASGPSQVASAQAQAIDAPATELPATEPPTTQPATEPPTQPPTEPPVTVPETTPAQPTEPPTLPDTTPAEPVQPVTPVTPESPTITVSPTTGSSSSVLPWILAGLGALILIGLIAWLIHSSTRRSDTVAAWRSRRLSAYAEGAALHDAIMSVQGRPMQPQESAARWADVQRRADDYNQRLYQLRETAPSEEDREQVDELLVSLQALRSALDAQRASGTDWTAGTTASMTAGVVRERLNDFRLLLSGLRDGAPRDGGTQPR